MILNNLNKLYDIKIYFFNKLLFKEKYIINVLDWYRIHNSEELTVIQYNESADKIVIMTFEFAEVVNKFIRDDKLLVFRNENNIKFEIVTQKE